MSESTYNHLLVESFDEGSIVRITLNRPRYRNAQHRLLLVELGDALLSVVASARDQGFDAERALRIAVRALQNEVRSAEASSAGHS